MLHCVSALITSISITTLLVQIRSGTSPTSSPSSSNVLTMGTLKKRSDRRSGLKTKIFRRVLWWLRSEFHMFGYVWSSESQTSWLQKMCEGRHSESFLYCHLCESVPLHVSCRLQDAMWPKSSLKTNVAITGNHSIPISSTSLFHGLSIIQTHDPTTKLAWVLKTKSKHSQHSTVLKNWPLPTNHIPAFSQLAAKALLSQLVFHWALAQAMHEVFHLDDLLLQVLEGGQHGAWQTLAHRRGTVGIKERRTGERDATNWCQINCNMIFFNFR